MSFLIKRPAPSRGPYVKKRLQMVGLTVACVFSGFGFYHAGGKDILVATAFTFGLTGIMLSVFRQS